AVLQERRALAPLRAADELASPGLDLERAGAREAERRRQAARRRHRDHLRARAESIEAAQQRAADPAVGLEQVGADTEVLGGGDDAVRQLALGPVVIDGASAGRTAHDSDPEPPARLDVDVPIQALAVAERDRGGRPGIKAQR